MAEEREEEKTEEAPPMIAGPLTFDPKAGEVAEIRSKIIHSWICSIF
jgi:hypothetical protein